MNRFVRIIYCTILICGLCSCLGDVAHEETRIKVYVVKIADGDTFTGLSKDKSQIKVRISGIDCPEKGQPYGKNAKLALSALIFNKNVYISTSEKDRYGRIISDVILEDQTNIAIELLKQGLAWHYAKYDTRAEYHEAEQKAKTLKIGLWKEKDIVAPWDWRKMSKEERNHHR